jgi:hypothetical protein
MVGGSLRILRLLPPLKLIAIAEILLKAALNTINQIKSNPFEKCKRYVYIEAFMK